MTITPGDRSVVFSTVFNFRDLGGLHTADGRKVRRGRLYRSDNLGRLLAADREAFAALGIKRVIDLRRIGEIATLGRIPEWTEVAWHHHHLEHELWDHTTYTEKIGVPRWLADRYRDLLESGAADIGRVITLLSNVDEGPTVVHCVAGKDRTGLISALTLSVLGVADEDIAHDYALTELSEPAYLQWLRTIDPDQAATTQPPFYTKTPADAMRLTLIELRERHGSVRGYLEHCGVTDSHLGKLEEGLVE
ncbi:MAG TPA: protein tyrosine phosphatase [Micromonosporaceae bacterium]|nr:protein tyrosine phosphatase [Micromonosporaceae bacterium]